MRMPFRAINSDARSDPTTVYLLSTLNHALSCMFVVFSVLKCNVNITASRYKESLQIHHKLDTTAV